MRNKRRTATSIFVVLSVRLSDLDIALFSEDKRLVELQLVYPEKRGKQCVRFYCALNMVTVNTPHLVNFQKREIKIMWIIRETKDGFGGLVVSMLVSGTQVCGFKPGRSRWIFLT